MSLRVHFLDRNRIPLNDPEVKDSSETASEIAFDWYDPKGMYSASCLMTRQDVTRSWSLKTAYYIQIKDGSAILWEGEIKGMPFTRAGTNESVRVNAIGPYSVFERRTIHKYWYDDNAIIRLQQPTSRYHEPIQNDFDFTRENSGNFVIVRCAMNDKNRSGGDRFHLEYVVPAGTYIIAVAHIGFERCGEQIGRELYNNDNAAFEYDRTYSGTGDTISEDHTLTQGDTSKITFYTLPDTDDSFDQSDYVVYEDLIVKSRYTDGHSVSSGSESYTSGELVEDILLMVAQDIISSDLDDIGEPGYTLTPFLTKRRTGAGHIIEEIAAYGDSQLRTWRLLVTTSTGTTDGLPKAVFAPVNTDVEDYVLYLNGWNVIGHNLERSDDDMYNYIIVEYTDERSVAIELTPIDDSSLENSTSIKVFGQRDYVLPVGKADATTAAYLGQRFLEFHAAETEEELKWKGSITVGHEIQQRDGGWIPVSYVRTPCNVRVYPFDEVMQIRRVSFREGGVSNPDTIILTPEIPTDNVNIYLRRAERLAEEVKRI